MAGVSIRNFTRHLPENGYAAFSAVAEEVLPGWDISLVFVGTKRAQALNEQLRGKTYTPDVLSYAVGEKSGEIIICPSAAAKQAPASPLAPRAYCLYLFIHGVLHIKGWAHNARMEACEQKLLAKHVTAHSNRHRYRHLSDKDSHRRRNRG